MIKWKEEYAVGIPMVDSQHKKLFEIAAEAEEMLLLDSSIDKYDEIKKIVEDLREYVVFHFNEEQKMMEEIAYPKYFTHRVQHQDFIEAMYKIEDNAIEEDQTKQLLIIVQTVIDWITAHVLVIDKAMAGYYKTIKK